MRILNLCETAKGGVGIYQRHVAALSSRGFEVHHLVPDSDADFLGADLRLETFRRKSRGLGAIREMLSRFESLLESLDPDVVFFHSTFALAALARMRMRGDRRPAIYCPHSWAIATCGRYDPKRPVVRLIEGRLAGLADRILCVSQNDRDIAQRLGYRGTFSVIENAAPEPNPNAVDTLFADDPDNLQLLFIGRLDRQKGFDILFDAMRYTARDDLRLHVVGDEVRHDGSTIWMSRRAIPVGWIGQDEIDSWYRSADALIVPSRWEGLPLVVPEALRNGTPVIVARRSGMEKLITPGVSGEVFDLDRESLATCLHDLDKARLRAMRPAARAAYEDRFTIDRMLDQLATMIRDVAAK
ncbi:glycosyltransferase family 4 protein [Roseisalinus antarcticus]|uniref:GDP-mannose-dependent alpha-mannosyltransferase n=1 Tax=Roseisalinus antarcticus TaxID=254357 RepID=A0A1Y5THX7_9RHOB|nr:glycosyltransferase family 4 protein [Roseisalinus antarcticus]SLN64362.1 GDP-mannose-dependent alpha-mannosyltransferase [Roseisalinus antarcticus]